MKLISQRTIVLLFALFVTAVTLPGIIQTAVAAPEAGHSPLAKVAVFESVTVAGEGDNTELVIKLSSPPVYTSYKTNAPLRLVLDVSQATPGDILEPIVINRGNFKTVTVNRYETDPGILTRVDISLEKDMEAVITAAPDNMGELRISFPAPPAPVAAVVEQPAPEAKEPVAATMPVAADDKAPSPPAATAATAPSVEVPAPQPEPIPTLQTKPAQEKAAKDDHNTDQPRSRSLKTLSVKGNTIILTIEGGAAEFKTFRLSNPERFIIDLFEVKNLLTSRVVPVNAAGVAMARIGQYPDKVRVVFDAVNSSFPDVETSKTDEGISILLKSANHAKSTTLTRDEIIRAEKAAEATLHIESRPVAPKVLPAKKPKPAATEPVRQQLTKETDKGAEVQTTPVAKPPQPETPKAGKQPQQPAERLPKSQAGPATIEMIDFQVIEGISRIAVKVAGEPAVEKPVKMPGFVSMTIKNTGLPKRLQRSLDTKGFPSPVLRVTPFIIKTAKGTDVKIKIALRSIAPFEFKQEGDILLIDFKNPPDIVAKRLPADLQETMQQKAASNKASATKEPDISSELSQPDSSAKTVDSAAKYKGRKVTLEFADAEVRKIFQLLSEVSNKNFVLGDDVSGNISIKLVNVPWDQALDIILDTKGLDKREDGNIIIIKAKGKFKSDVELEQENKKVMTRSMEMKTEMFNVNYANLADIKSQFEKLRQHERASISEDSRTNKLIVRDIPQAIEDMRKLKDQLDVPEKQVMIEARIIEASSTFTRTLGVNWGLHFRDGSASFFGINSLDTGFGGITSAPPTTGTGTGSGSTMGISFGTLTSNIKLDMRLNAAASVGLIKIVSSPKVATINNKTAKISQGTQIPYQNTTATTGAVTAFVAATLSLEVTPHINANGTIGMKIDAKNDAPGTGSPPSISTKSATTELLLRDGETTVIGGIYVDSDTESDEGVPFLMDIPMLGKMFKSNDKRKSKTELLIFITPRIIGTI